MNNVNHPYGNNKIAFIKFCKNQIKLFIRFILSFFFKFSKNDQIIISSAVHCPWLEDREFKNSTNLLTNIHYWTNLELILFGHFQKI